jgi:hypothetical protein
MTNNTNERNEMNKISKIEVQQSIMTTQNRLANQAECKMLVATIDWHSRLRRGVILGNVLGIDGGPIERHNAAIRDAELRLNQLIAHLSTQKFV